MAFGTDQVLLYNVEPWGELGFGCPNFADNTHTVCQPMRGLAHEIGQAQLFIMTHVDVMRDGFPSRNTVERIGMMLNRVRSVLLSRARQPNEKLTEAGHGTPAAEPWLIHPCPFFEGPIIKNGWLAEYNRMTMIALANAYQHTGNSYPLAITQAFASDIWIFFEEIVRMLGVELLGLTKEVVLADSFRFATEHYAAYDPSGVTIRRESLQLPPDPRLQFTEQDLHKFDVGIPANLIRANLAIWPAGGEGAPGAENAERDPADKLPGVDDGTALRQTL